VIPASIIIPIADNEGKPFADGQFVAFEDHLLGLADGLTRRDNVMGQWRADDGVVYRDVSYEYEVSMGSWRDIGAFLAVADRAREEFRQLAVYVRIAGIPEVLEANSMGQGSVV
jgi:hypothetical protein